MVHPVAARGGVGAADRRHVEEQNPRQGDGNSRRCCGDIVECSEKQGLVRRAAPLMGSDVDNSGEASEQAEVAEGALWLPVAQWPRPIFPLERCVLRASRPHAQAALLLARERRLPIAVTSMPAASAEGGERQMIGTALHLDCVTELPDGVGVEAVAVGLCPVRIDARGALACRLPSGEVGMVNVASVVRHADRAVARGWFCSTLRQQVLRLLGTDAETAAAAPEDAESFSWWAAARLPLPPWSRGQLLAVPDAEERLSICCTVLGRFAAAGGAEGGARLPLRAKL